MLNVALLIISDGRQDYLKATLESIDRMLPAFAHVVHVDDSAHELGFAGAIAEGWRRVRQTQARWVWHAEQDFTYSERVDLDRMVATLCRHPHLVQLVLKRQPWNDAERAAGGIVEQHPTDFAERREFGDAWTEHRRFFSTNPCLYRASLCDGGWPQERHSEGVFTHQVLEADPAARFAFWGAKHAAPRVHHIGEERAGCGY